MATVDDETLPETDHFGFTRIGDGEQLSKNGWASTDGDRVVMDKLFYAALNHDHSGDAALGDPTDEPGLTALPTGGTLPAATTYYYRVSFVDQWGLETAAGPESAVTTADAIDMPTAPAITVETSSGTVGPGVYSYLISFADLYGGETTPSPMASASVASGSTNRVRLNLPDMPSGASTVNVYRSRPGQTQFYYLGTSSTGIFYDAGAVEDQTITVPTTNTTNATNSVQVTIPLAFIPDGCYGWKIYRAVTSGDYDGTSLVHWVTEGQSDTDTTPRTTWTDTGDTLLDGFPPDANSCAGSGTQLSYGSLSGSVPLTAMPRGAQVLSAFLPGTVTNNQVVTVTEVPMPLQPTRFTAYFQTPPASTQIVRIRFTDTSANYVELSCPSTPQSGDAAGYYHYEYPLYLAESFEAENGTRSSLTGVAIANDVAASSGQAVALASQNDYVDIHLGTLDAGVYQAYFTSRVLQYATSSTNDLQVSVIRADNSTVVGAAVSYTLTSSTTPSATNYVERNGPSFTAPGNVDLKLRIKKTQSTLQAYNIDSARFTATVPTLVPGTITARAFVDNGPTVGGNVNVALWF